MEQLLRRTAHNVFLSLKTTAIARLRRTGRFFCLTNLQWVRRSRITLFLLSCQEAPVAAVNVVAADRKAQSFIIDAFDKTWYSEQCETVKFYAWVTTRQMLYHLKGICVGNHAIDILELQDKMQVMYTEHELFPNTFGRSRKRSINLQELACKSRMQRYS